MKKLIILINFLVLFLLLKCEQNIYENNAIIEWGLNNSLYLSSYIELSKLGKNKIKFIAKIDIPKNKNLLTIPYNLMFNVNKVIELINSKTLTKQFKEFQKLNLTSKSSLSYSRKEEAFLSYILYLINHKPKKYKKTKFFEFYEKYLEILRKYRPKSPLFYEPKQIQYLAGSLLDKTLDEIRKIYQDEIDLYINNEYYKKVFDYDEYAHYRLGINKYGLNISNHWTVVPFLNYFDDDYLSYNSNYTINKNGDVGIYTKKDIKKGEEIILYSPKRTNIQTLIMEGKTNEKLVDYFTEYPISAFSPGIYLQYGLEDKDYFRNYYVNILDNDFDSQLLKIYKEHADVLQGDGSDSWAYDLLDLNLNFYKEHFEGITLDRIYEIYYDTDDRINIERIIRGERKIVQTIYDKAYKIIDVFLEKEEKRRRRKRAMNNDL